MKRLLITLALLAVPGAATAESIDSGRKIFVANCQRCHGPRAQGGVGVKLAGDAAYWDTALFRRAVLNGVDDEGKHLKKVMPLFGKVGLTDPKGKVPSDEDIADVQAYIRTLAPKTAH